MLVSISSLRADVHRALTGQGVPDEEATVGAELCLDSELRGHRSHGIRLLRNVTAEYSRGSDRREPLRVRHQTPASAQIDGAFHLSWYVHGSAVDLVAEKALQTGIAIVSVRNAGVSGALGSLVERGARQGVVMIAMNSTPLTVVAPDGSVPMLGTNPLAFAVPRSGGHPLVLDMATSSIAFNQVLRLRETGGALPSGVASDAAGDVTTDPSSAIDPVSGRGRILPFGGHRGYGLSLMIELLVSAAVTGRSASGKRGPVVLEPADFGGLYIAYRPDLVGDPQSADDATEALISELLASGARLPGEDSRLRREGCISCGKVNVDQEALDYLQSLLRN